MISEAFQSRVTACGRDAAKLTELLASIDEDKRRLRNDITRYQVIKRESGLSPEQRDKLIRMRDRLAFLLEEREYVRQLMGRYRSETAALNRAINGRQPNFAAAFMAVAERRLPPELFEELERKAIELLPGLADRV